MAEKHNRFALIIASYDYTADAGLRKLVAPPQDAEALTRVLQDPTIGGFEVRSLLNEPSPKVAEEIEAFFAERQRDDLALLYFSGHGVKDTDGQLYFAMPNTRLNRLRSTSIKASDVNEIMRGSRAQQKVLLLDCCYSGAFARGMTVKADQGISTQDYFDGRGYAILTASDAIQYSFEEDKVEGQATQSVFTRILTQGLDKGEADTNGDGLVTFDEMYDYILDHIEREAPEQRPRKWALDVQGKIVIGRNPRPVVKPAPLPAELQQTIEDSRPWVREGAVRELGRLLEGSHPGLALAAQEALKRLAEDDSRRVSVSAKEALSAYEEAQRARMTAEAERLAAQRAEAERRASEKAEQERLAREKAEVERLAAQKAEAERLAAQKAEAERLAAQRAEAERRASEKAKQERLAHEKAEAERLAARIVEEKRLAHEKAEAERAARRKAKAEPEQPSPTMPYLERSRKISAAAWVGLAVLGLFGSVLLFTALGNRNSLFDGARTATPTLGIDSTQVGRVVFVSYRDSDDEIYIMNADGSGQTRLTNSKFGDSEPVLSPDGQYIVFVSQRDGGHKLFIMNADGSNWRQLTDGKSNDEYSPYFSPDSQWVLYSSNRGGRYEVWLIHPDGTGLTQLTSGPNGKSRPAWSPDGQWITYNSVQGNEDIIKVIRPDGTDDKVILVKDDASVSGWVGGRILFDAKNGTTTDIYSMNPDGSDIRQLTTDPANDKGAFGTLDGTFIVFNSTRDGNDEIYVMRADGSDQKRLTSNPDNDYMPTWGP